jgi:hypothetical protein
VNLRDADLARDPRLAQASKVREVEKPPLPLVEGTKPSGQERTVLARLVPALSRRLQLPFAVPVFGE